MLQDTEEKSKTQIQTCMIFRQSRNLYHLWVNVEWRPCSADHQKRTRPLWSGLVLRHPPGWVNRHLCVFLHHTRSCTAGWPDPASRHLEESANRIYMRWQWKSRSFIGGVESGRFSYLLFFFIREKNLQDMSDILDRMPLVGRKMNDWEGHYYGLKLLIL